MQCAKCQAQIDSFCLVCPECGEVTAQIEGFDNTKEIVQTLKTIIDNHGEETVYDPWKFVAFLNDYLPDYDKERRLLVNAVTAGVIKNMTGETDEERKISSMAAKSYMMEELCITENAAEFVLMCFTYVMGWKYEPVIVEKPQEQAVKEQPEKEEKKTNAPASIESKIFGSMDAVKYRLSKRIEVGEGYTKVDSFCFDGFGFVRIVKLPETLLAIGDYAFSNCKHLVEVQMPQTLKVIEAGAFNLCVNLENVTLPKGILEIADSTFSFCQSLEKLEVPDTVSSIGAQAFASCENLSRLILPESVKYIEGNAFEFCPKLTIKCYENSYAHKFCLSNKIKVETAVVGTSLSENKNVEDEDV